jgi:hypothetical protein
MSLPENNHVSNQSRHGNTRGFKKRSSNGISVRLTPAQKEIMGRKELAKEKPGEQKCIK